MPNDSIASQISTAGFPDAVHPLLHTVDQMPFDFSIQSSNELQTQIANLTLKELCHGTVANKAMANCCRSGLWVLHGNLHESHEISQSIHSPEGSYWHGLMHRAEGDFWNSKYWYSKAGKNHPVAQRMRDHDSAWSGDSFVDDCERAVNSPANDKQTHEALNQLARQEWFYLFQHCWSVAIGK